MSWKENNKWLNTFFVSNDHFVYIKILRQNENAVKEDEKRFGYHPIQIPNVLFSSLYINGAMK